MQKQAYNEGIDIIKNISEARYEIKRAYRGIDNANFRISGTGGYIDEMWIKIKEDEQKKLQDAMQKFEQLQQNLMALKSHCTNDEWNYLLQTFGVTLAETANIEHVANSLWDAHDLHDALNQTSSMIQQKHKELSVAKEKGDDDLVTIINAELSYYDSDMRKHFWGESRLESLYSDIKTGDKTK